MSYKRPVHKKTISNRIIYEYFLNNKIIKPVRYLDTCELLNRIEALCEFANACYPGILNDYRIENLLLDIGNSKIIDKTELDKNQNLKLEKNQIVHVATKLLSVGGHTRVLSAMLERIEDPQILILTKQRIEDIPKWFLEKHKELNIITFQAESTLLQRAKLLFNYCLSQKIVFLYTHWSDVIPIISFAKAGCPLILFENHQHSWFWLGNSISDVVFSHTEFHEQFTRKYRNVNMSYLFPFTQLSKEELSGKIDVKDKQIAKHKIGVNVNDICILTVATKSKFYPLTREYNIFKLINEILYNFPQVYYIVVGIDESTKEIKSWKVDTTRARFVGYKDNLYDYYLAADICVDSIPEPSLGSTKMAAIVGLACPLFKFGGSGVYNYNDLRYSSYRQYIGHNKNKDEFLDKLDLLIKHPEIRFEIASEIRNDYLLLNNEQQLTREIGSIVSLSKNQIHKINRYTFNKENINIEFEEIAVLYRNMKQLMSFLGIFDV